jgi:hypothetical protein
MNTYSTHAHNTQLPIRQGAIYHSSLEDAVKWIEDNMSGRNIGPRDTSHLNWKQPYVVITLHEGSKSPYTGHGCVTITVGYFQ